MATIASLVVNVAADVSNINRNLEGVSSQLTRLESTVATTTSGINTKMVAVGTAIGTFIGVAAVGAVKALGREMVELAANGIKMAPIVSSFERLTASIGESGNAMLAVTRTATKGLVKDLDIMQAANKAILLGLPVTSKEFGVLAEAATSLGRAMGQDATKSLDDLITALGRSSPMILDNLGLSVKLGEANEKYAKSIGKTAEQLTDGERKLAFYNAALDAARAKMRDLGETTLTVADQLTRIKNGFTNFTDALGVAIARSPVLNELLGTVADGVDGAFGDGQVQKVQNLIKIINKSAIALVDFGIVAVDVASGVNSAWVALTDAVSLNVAGMARAIIGHMRSTIDTLIAVAAVINRFDPTGIAERNLKLLVATRMAIDNTSRGTNEFGRSLDTASEKLTALRGRLVELANTQVSNATIAGDLANRTRNLGDASEDAAKKAKKAAEAYRQMYSDARNAQGMFFMEMDALILNAANSDATKKLQGILFGTGLKGPQPTDIKRSALDGVKELMDAANSSSNPLAGLMDKLTSSAAGLGSLLKNQLAPTVLNAVMGGGSVTKSIGGLLGGGIASQLAGEGVKKAISGALGSTIGAAVGSVIPGLGTMIGAAVGPLIGKLGGALKGLFGGVSQKELDGRKAVQDFEALLHTTLSLTQQAEAGGKKWAMTTIAVRDAYLATGRSARDAEQDVLALWNSSKKGAEAAKAAADKINQAFIEQQQDAERLEAAFKKYGFSLEERGAKLRAQKLHEQALELVEDWRVLVASGIDIALVNDKMAESINAYLQSAITAGIEVPAAMRPILQSLVDQGKLTDSAGNLITDLSTAGITFAETMTQGFDRVVAKLDQLLERLGMVGTGLASLPDVDIAMPEPDGAFEKLRRGARPMANGGFGTVTGPTLFLAGEAGTEQFAFSGANKSFGSGDTKAVVVSLEAVRAELAAIRRDQAATTTRAMKDALAVARLKVS